MNYRNKIEELMHQLPHKVVVQYAYDVAKEVSHTSTDNRVHKCLDTIRLWLEDGNKVSNEELSDAAAYAAAYAANAACAAACAADAAYAAAADAAAYAAAYAAYCVATYTSCMRKYYIKALQIYCKTLNVSVNLELELEEV